MLILDSIITGGYVDPDTLRCFERKGFKFVATIPAKLVHPHAMDTDKLTIFAKYEENVVDDNGKTLGKLWNKDNV